MREKTTMEINDGDKGTLQVSAESVQAFWKQT